MAANDKGRSRFGLVLDNSQLQAGARQASNILRGIGNSAEAEGSRIDNAYKKIAGGIAGVFTIQQAASFIKQIANIRGEFQQLEVAFETMLQSKQKADALMSQLVGTAAVTPFGLKDVAQGAKQLLAYGEASETVNDTLVRLGNIAAGLSIPLNDLVYLYGTTMVQGRLFTQDVRQFQGRGIPLVQELAKELGKTTNEINEMVTAGTIGFPEVQKVIQNLTGEGGTFYNLMEKQSKTITGQISNLGDAWDTMLNKIGQSNEGVISGAISGATSLVENYEAVGREIMALVTAYGAYKAALIALNAIQTLNSRILGEALLIRKLNRMEVERGTAGVVLMSKAEAVAEARTKLFTLAQHGLAKAVKATTAAMMKNPYVLVAAAVAALAYGIYKLVTAETAAEAAQRKHNEAMEAAREKKENLISKTQQLTDTINDETQTIYAQIKAWKELQEEMPETFGNMTMQEFKNMKPEDSKKLINKAADDREISDLDKALKNAEERVESLGKMVKAANKGSAGMYKTSAVHSEKQLKEAEETLRLLKSQKAHRDEIIQQAEFEAKPLQEKIAYYDEEITKLNEQKRQLDTILLGNKEIANEWGGINFETLQNITRLEAINDLLNEMKGKLATLQALPTNANYGELYNNAKAEWEAAVKTLSSIEKYREKYTKEQYDEAVEDLKTKKKAYEDLGGDTKMSKNIDAANQLKAERAAREQQIRKYTESLVSQQKQSEFEIEQARIDTLEDGLEKEKAQIKLNYEKLIEENRLREQEWIEELQKKTNLEYENKNPEWKKKGLSGPKTVTKEDLTEEQRDLLKKYEKQTADYLKKQTEKAVKADKEKYATLLQQFGDYEQKKKGISEEWERKIAELPKELQKNAEKMRDRELSEVDADFIEKTALWEKFFDDAEKLSLNETRRIGDSLREMIMKIADPEVKKELLKMLDEVSKKAEGNANAIELMFGDSKGAGVANLFFGEGDFKSKIQAFSTIFKGAESASEGIASNAGKAASSMKMAGSGAAGTLAIIDAIIKGIHGTIQGIYEVVQYFKEYEKEVNGQVSQKTKDISESLEILATFDEKVYSGWEKLKSGNVIGAITDNIIAWHGLFTAGSRRAAAWQKEIDAMMQNMVYGEIRINQLYRERYEWEQKTGELTLDYLRRKGEELGRQSAENKENYNTVWGLLQDQTYLKDKYTQKKYGVFGIDFMAKDKHVEEWKSLKGMSYEEIELLYEQGRLSEEAVKHFEELKRLKEEGIDIDRMRLEYEEKIKETVTGSSYSSIVNSIVEGFKDGKRSAADFAETFEDLMQGAVASSLSLLADEKMRKWYEDFAAMGEDDYTEDEIAKAKEDYLRYIEQLAEDAKVLEEVTGVAISGERQAAQKGFASMSQDSADELNGRFTAMQAHTYSITENTKILVVNSSRILNHLAGIESNTESCRRLNGMDADLKAIKNSISDIVLKGITIKK